ncbi:hypothetical protein [Nesterenkonia populi]
MFVVTADQHRSRQAGDKVSGLLEELGPWFSAHAESIVLPMERTVGDEVQILLDDADAALDLALRLMRLEEWAVGVGAGPVEEPLGPSARQSSGEAFFHAREAVERARGRAEPVPLVIRGAAESAAGEATAVAQLVGAILRRRSAEGWQVADGQAQGKLQKQIAEGLGISPQAVGQRARAALIEEEQRVRPVVARLLREAASSG